MRYFKRWVPGFGGIPVLAELDYVASVHSSFSQIEAEMTERIIRAIEHPSVTMLGHPTGRPVIAP